jgi:DnaK suppressor protein
MEFALVYPMAVMVLLTALALGGPTYAPLTCIIAVSIDWRERLLRLRAEIESIMDSGADASAIVELDQSKVGRLSRMDAMQGQAMAQASRVRYQQRLRLIDAAVARVDSEDYGYCQQCEEPIDIGRLKFDPTMLLCVDCATKAEGK